MKKNLLVVLVMAMVSSFAIAENQEANNTSSVSATAADLSHWSFGIKGGINYLDVFDSPMRRDDQWHLMGGAVLEYTFTRVFGLGAEYEYNPYDCAILHNGTDLITPDAFGRAQDASLFASLNLSNLLKPEREGFWKETNVYANIGGGVSFYKFDTQGNTNLLGNGISPLGYVGLNAEHNLSKSWAVGLEGQYRYYADKEMGGIYSQADINQGGTVTLGLRYKFCANTKQHIRNNAKAAVAPVPVVEPKVEPQPVPAVVPATKPEPVAEVKPEPVKEEPVINLTFENILFKFDSSELTEASTVIIDNLVNTLGKYKGWSKLQINGHTDNVGTDTYNQALSERRVASVKNYIVGKGIDESKITYTGFGEEKPKTTNDTKEGRKTNRRVEFEVSK